MVGPVSLEELITVQLNARSNRKSVRFVSGLPFLLFEIVLKYVVEYVQIGAGDHSTEGLDVLILPEGGRKEWGLSF